MPPPGYVFRDGLAVPDAELKHPPQSQHESAPAAAGEETALEPVVTRSTTSNTSGSRVDTPTSSSSSPSVSSPPAAPGSAPVLGLAGTDPGAGAGGDALTDSHALANSDHEEKGAVQQHGEKVAAQVAEAGAGAGTGSADEKKKNGSASASGSGQGDDDGGNDTQQAPQIPEVRDMGWQEHPRDVPAPLVGGLPNEELWTLVRRFNKQMYHVKATQAPQLGGLDVNIVEEEEFSPDKLRSNLERLYMTVIIGLMAAGKHVARLRSWREPRRTGAFLAAYSIAWIFNFLVPLLLLTIITLVVYPRSRAILFPPAPLALVNASTGGVQTPKAGVLGSHDSATGAPEAHQGEAVEQEAHNFVTGIGSIALSSAAGKHEQGDPEQDPLDASVPDPTKLATVGAEAKVSAAGQSPDAKTDKTKQPMEDAMWKQMRPIMHVIGDISDGWERFANALSPTKPFPQQKPRLVLASVLVPLVAVSLLTSSYVFVKMSTAGIGFGFFGDPLIWRGLDFLNEKVPNWQKLLEIRNSLLKGVPTNAQLTVTLLRIGEANRAPLPPPPRSDEPPPSKPASINGDEITATLDTNHEELHEAIHKSEDQKQAEAEYEQKEEQEAKHKHRHGEKILGFFKGTTNAGVQTKFGIDKARAHALGSESAKETLGIIPKDLERESSGPVDFKARYKGSKGWVIISTKTDIPTVAFSKVSSEKTGSFDEKKAEWVEPIQDITELKKIGGLGWKAKIVVGWATGKQIADGLEIMTKDGKLRRVTAIRLREELFNRLVSMGGQKWESW